ncbi:MAG: Quinoprotein glucose dehydrogenase, partial [Flavipsychrobacter sp.]|nr:Quinoprotein glucose dehydrogenase [Flavipsychrobacter sp.]
MRIVALLYIIGTLLTNVAKAQVLKLPVSTRVLKDSLFIPWEILYGPDNHIWLTQKNGYICRMDTAGKHVDTLYHEPKTVTIKESGMLGMVLHPDFAATPYVYVAWEYLDSPLFIHERIWRYTYSAAANSLSDPVIILDSIHGYIFHNGCRLAIVEGKLFISAGDAEDFVSPQCTDSINGKILRINLDGSIPADNPIPGNPAWTWGHRNPQGLVYANGMLYSSEHGPTSDDELNLIMKGRNYGWPNVIGYCDNPSEDSFCRDSNVVEPLRAFTPSIAPSGIDYYHHPMFPWLQNSIIMATLKDKHLYQLELNDTHDAIINVSVIEGVDYGRLRDVCISPDGKIFVSTSNSNPADTGGRIDKIIEVYNPGYDVSRSNDILLYPNPAERYLYISLPRPYSQLHFSLGTTDGKKISEGIIYT